MWRHPILKVVLLVYVGWGAWHWYVDRPVHPPDGILAAGDPQQTNLSNGEKLRMGHWTLTMRAHYEVTARVLSKERYRFDALADLIPEDLALGWGVMSDNRVLRSVDISQSNRFYYWRMPADSPVAPDAVITHSANTHMIPRSGAVKTLLSRLRTGQVVTLSGDLVDAVRDDGRWINTSLVRTDSGPGACEVLLVSDVSVNDVSRAN
jgi:hypothetical protein